MDLNCRKGALSYVTVKRGGQIAWGDCRASIIFQESSLGCCLSGQRLAQSVPSWDQRKGHTTSLKSEPGKDFRQLIRAVMVNSHHYGAFICHPHFCLLLQSLTSPKGLFFICLSLIREWMGSMVSVALYAVCNALFQVHQLFGRALCVTC